MTAKRKKDTLFAVCTPGLEPYTTLELRGSGLLPSAPDQDYRKGNKPHGVGDESGGVEFRGRLKAVYLANLTLRTANRVLLRLGEFYAASLPELRHKAGQLEWERFLVPGRPVMIRVTCHKSRLYHSGAVSERIVGAIGDRLQQPSPVQSYSDQEDGAPAQLVVARLYRDICTINVDSSGALLHRRGYRLGTARAPLRETLAAGMLLASGWDNTSPLLDPFCGSGTIPIEAALMARGQPPGANRHFAFMDWPSYDPYLWAECLEETKANQPVSLPPILASDRDSGAIEIAQANAERAGVANDISFSQRVISAIEPAGIGWVVTNMPYGRRVSPNKDLRDLYAQFGNVMRAKCPGWQVGVLSNDLQFLGNIGIDLDTSLSMDNGGVRVRFGRGVVAIP